MNAAALRLKIEAALADRIPSALTPATRVIRPVAPTGIAPVDDLLEGGLPLGAITEAVGPECSGRTSLALSFVAQMTQTGKVCAWVDVSDTLDPESAAAIGVDLNWLLWVRCGAADAAAPLEPAESHFTLPEKYRIPAPQIKGLHGGGFGPHPRTEAKGLSGAVGEFLRSEEASGLGKGHDFSRANPTEKINGALQAAEKVILEGSVTGHDFSRAEKANQINRALAPEGSLMGDSHQISTFSAACLAPKESSKADSRQISSFSKPSATRENGRPQSSWKPWTRIDQALRVTDLLLQAGGFSAIVLDMGSIAPADAARVPMASWFRYRAAAERTQASILLLTQHPCAKSSAGLLLRLEPGRALQEEPTVFTGLEHRLEVTRERFQPQLPRLTPSNVMPIRKPPQSERGASWHSRTNWAGVR